MTWHASRPEGSLFLQLSVQHSCHVSWTGTSVLMVMLHHDCCGVWCKLQRGSSLQLVLMWTVHTGYNQELCLVHCCKGSWHGVQAA